MRLLVKLARWCATCTLCALLIPTLLLLAVLNAAAKGALFIADALADGVEAVR